ncbi:MAG: site-2 protease family protein [Coriobacteriales bacterium]|nr:site-2 protease family protein [Coriobacteriales bacterium]
MLGLDASRLGEIVLTVCIVLVATILHEVAHAATAYKLGDATAKERGRLTLNPAAHLDPVGSVLLPILMAIAGGPVFAFAKPVPYNPSRLKHPVRDEVLVALAGPACNLVQALVGAVAFRLCYAGYAASVGTSAGFYVACDVSSSFVYINLMLMFFNLIPLPPLDGSAIIFPLLKGEARRRYYVVQRYAMPVLLAVLYLVPMLLHVDPVGMYLHATAGNLSMLLMGM